MDDSPEKQTRINTIDNLLTQFIDQWHIKAINKRIDLTISLSELDQKMATGDVSVIETLKGLAKELIPADWKDLGNLVQQYRLGGQTRANCLRGIIARSDRKQKQYDLWIAEETDRQAGREAARLQGLAIKAEIMRRQEEDRKRKELEEAEREKKRQERQKEILREKQKQIFIRKLWDKFDKDFINAHKNHSAYAEYITNEEFDHEKTRYVRKWFEKHSKIRPDKEQAGAIAEVNENILVIARAGSGKTQTLTSRAIFLLQHCGVKPNEILLLAFNKKAAEEMKKRISKVIKGKLIHAMTFHALAYALVHPEEELIFDESSMDQFGLSVEVQAVIDEYLKKEKYRDCIRELMLMHFRGDWERIVRGHFELTMEEFLAYRRSLPRESLKGDFVKSFGERLIANTLFENGIDYKYERNFRWDGINYRPDFTIPFHPTGNGGVIIEYFGLQDDADYDQMSEKKRLFWAKQKNWKFLEFSPDDITKHGIDHFIVNLISSLENVGLSCHRLSEENIWELVKRRAIDGFTMAMRIFIGRCRKLNISVKQLREMVDIHIPCNEAEGKFLDIAVPIYENYLERLVKKKKEDFDGLMWRAIAILRDGHTHFIRDKGRERGDLAKLRFVMIDEFQDFSQIFFELIQAITSFNDAIQFFCVGDDWQAINAFAGSNLKFFNGFDECFKQTKIRHIHTNYRSPEIIVNVGNALMNGRGDPAKAYRTDQAFVFKVMLDKFEPTISEQAKHNGDEFTPALLRIINLLLKRGLNIVMLSRRNGIPGVVNYNSHANADALARFLEHIRSFFPEDDRWRITISTVHQYKGLENDAVIILDAIRRSYPLIHPNWVFLRILGDTVNLIEEEERRIFYVAITRPKSYLFLLTEKTAESSYLGDIRSYITIHPLSWKRLLPVASLDNPRIEIRVYDAFHAKEDLAKLDFRYDSASSCWQKSVLVKSFSLQALRKQSWATSGVEIKLFDETGQLLESI